MMTSAASLSRFTPSQLAAVAKTLTDERDKRRLEDSLLEFVEAVWPTVDPAPYQRCWAIDALCEHLQAVADGQIKRLLANFPPRAGKTTVTSVCYPAWTWARRHKSYLSGAQVRFLCGSYNDELSLQNAMRHRRLLLSPWYQQRWGQRFGITGDQNTKSQFDTTAGGSRLSVSVRGSLLGFGGDVICLDDPHNTRQAESEAERASALTWWREISTTRLNDPKRSAIVVIMQRLHEEDVSGTILASEWSDDWTHLMIPMEYDWRRHCVTVLGWQDPRGIAEDGAPLITVAADGSRIPRDSTAELILDNERQNELMWPERFGATEIRRIKAELGPYMASGRLQQMPVPDRGGIFNRDWWQIYDSPDGKFPLFDYLVASLDSAFTEKEENDPCALTIWGCYTVKDEQTERVSRRIMLVHAWRKHLAFSAERKLLEPFPQGGRKTRDANGVVHESGEWIRWRHRTQEHWGLMEWVDDTCNRFNIDKLLIEAKASGISAAQELQNRFGRQSFAVQLCPVVGDKVARALAVQPTFAQGLIYAPMRDWAFGNGMTVDEMAAFPKGRYDDLTDSATQAVKHLRDAGLAATDEEISIETTARAMHCRQAKPLYAL